MKVTDLFVRQLEEEGVTHVFGVPGEENLDLLESLRVSKIIFVICRHEQAAAFMAATFGRYTGKAGVCLSTLGPGATNLVTGIAHAQLCGFPLLAITGQKGIRNTNQGIFQVVDVVGMMRPLTKSAVSVTSPRRIGSIVHDAVRIAESDRPGATHIELAEDIADDQSEKESVHTRIDPPRTIADPRALDHAKELLRGAKRPYLLVGGGANRPGIQEALKEFVNKTGIAVVATQMGKGILSERDPHSLFSCGIHKKDYVHCALHAADLIITIGYDIVEHPSSVWNPTGDTPTIHLNTAFSRTDEFYNPACELIGDIAASLQALSVGWNAPKSYTEEVRRLRTFIDTSLHALDRDDRCPLIPQRIVADVRSVMGDEDIISLDNGIYKLWFARGYPCYAPLTMLVDNALATMGAGLPVAMAAKMLHPKRNVLAICGDGGFMMNSQEIETAIRLKLDLTILLLNDNAYGFIEWKQQNMGFPEFGMKLGNPDFLKYAEAYGAKGYRIQKAADLKTLLQQTMREPGVKLIECPIDYAENVRVFNGELDTIVCPA